LPGPTYTHAIEILLVCTANQCRSPMAEGLLRRSLARAGVVAMVHSSGLLPGGVGATAEAIATVGDRGVDISGHVSRTIDDEMVRDADLIICMARLHVREACAAHRAPLNRTFTLKELVRRGEQIAPRAAGEPVAAWLARAGAGRRPADLLGASDADDVADPVGRPRAVYEDTADELEDLLDRLAALLRGYAGDGATYAYPAQRERET
jgi:low molecular weight protein-tyrosine phosphatase